ncbi:ABC transporter substrate-binding protein [Bradyrhizobium sp. PMVTL-01]|uniref:ABC transporter substrate-binding protein n=1 Tax=Bradyrhizobium sp. PMVTL-01 TaxID=3434999 RepID=UPI003F72E842
MRRRDFIGVLSGVVALPLSAGAQQPVRSYRIAYLALLPDEDTTLAKPFLERLRELGYDEGKNITLAYRSADGRPERLPQLAAELVQARPDVLVTGFGTLAAKAAMGATSTIPVVFTMVGDPIGAGLVVSLGRPGANVTGFSDLASEFAAKRLQLLQNLIPGQKLIAVLGNPDTPFTALALKQVKTAAAANHQPLAVFEARTRDEVSASIKAAVKSGAAGLMTLDDPLLLSAKQQIIQLLADARLPAIYGLRDYVEANGLMSYSMDRPQMCRRAADYVDKILRGAVPADLPVEQPTKFELTINLKAAKALGIDIPSSLLAIADEVIE